MGADDLDKNMNMSPDHGLGRVGSEESINLLDD